MSNQEQPIQFLTLGNEVGKPFVVDNLSPVSPQFKATQRKNSVVSEVDLNLSEDDLTKAVADDSFPVLSVL